MSRLLAELMESELAQAAPAEVCAFAASLVDPARDAAVLYYGSTLRTGDLSGILDFYRLTRSPHRRGLRGLVEGLLWPEVSYHELSVDGRVLRAKVATMPLSTFKRAAEGRTLDTTVWARFVQPAARLWSADPAAARETAEAVAAAVRTAARYAAAMGPMCGAADAFWNALFRRTYAAEFRVETPERAGQVLSANPERYAALLPFAWQAAGIEYSSSGGELQVNFPGGRRRSLRWSWAIRRAMGKPLNLARLAKAAFTFDGAAHYAAWKIQRHTGVVVEVTPFRARHPILAAPVVLLKLAAARRQAEARRARSSNPNS